MNFIHWNAFYSTKHADTLNQLSRNFHLPGPNFLYYYMFNIVQFLMCTEYFTQGALLNPNKVLKETKPPAYPCTQHLRSAPPLSHQPIRQYFQPEAQHQSIPEMEQWSQDEPQSQHQQTHSQTQHHHTHKHSRPVQHHSQPHAKYQQQLLYNSQTHQPHISLQVLSEQQQQHHALYTQFQPHQIPEEQYQWQMPCQEGQYQKQPVTFPSPGQEKNWNHVTGPRGLQHAQMKRRHCMQMPEEPKLLSKVAVQETQGKGSKVPHYNESEVTEANPGLQDNGFELNKASPVCIRVCKLDVMIIIMIINTFFVTGIICWLASYPTSGKGPFPAGTLFV